MTSAELLAALAEYDPEIEWESVDGDGKSPFVCENDGVEWVAEYDGMQRIHGCHKQQCDFIDPHSVADVMRAMDAAANALNDYLRGLK